MGEPDDLPGPESDRVVERDETYEHDDFGLVEVTGIWRGIHQVDSARHIDQRDVIIVRYSTEEDGKQVVASHARTARSNPAVWIDSTLQSTLGTVVDELTEPLDEFIEATE